MEKRGARLDFLAPEQAQPFLTARGKRGIDPQRRWEERSMEWDAKQKEET